MGIDQSIRVALVSDTHGVVDDRIVNVISECDYAVHAGDIGGAVVLARLRPLKRVMAVRGNNDTAYLWPDEDTATLEALPHEYALSLPGGILVAVHGDRARHREYRHRWLRERYQNTRAIVYGNKHQLICDQGELPWVLNPGASKPTAGHR